MGAILCRVSKTAQVRTKYWCASDRRASIKAASEAARSPRGGGAQAARDSKGNYRPRPRFSPLAVMGESRGGSRKGASPSGGDAERRRGGNTTAGCALVLPTHIEPRRPCTKRVRGIGGGVKRPRAGTRNLHLRATHQSAGTRDLHSCVDHPPPLALGASLRVSITQPRPRSAQASACRTPYPARYFSRSSACATAPFHLSSLITAAAAAWGSSSRRRCCRAPSPPRKKRATPRRSASTPSRRAAPQ